jgi:hypothetical protein
MVKVAVASSAAEAELILGMLRDQGIPARMAADLGSVFPTGPHEILVPESAYEAARELLPDKSD